MLSFAERVDPRHSVLIVVDIQNDFCASDGGMAKRGADTSLAQAIIPGLITFVDQARVFGLPVIFTKTVHDVWTNSAVWLERSGEANTKSAPVCTEGSLGAEFYRIEPAPQDRVVVKHRYSAFYGTDLELLLRAGRTETVIITGVMTNVCVETTAREAFIRDYNVVVVSDCCATATQAEHDATMNNIQRYFGVVATAGQLLETWAAGTNPTV